nr:hypothetical protein [Evansella caseinilytica]
MILFITIGIVNYINKPQANFVSREDVEMKILNMEEKEENLFYITAEIINNSHFDLESNHIFISEINHNNSQLPPETATGTTGKTDAVSSAVAQTKYDEQLQDIPVMNQKGDFSRIPANSFIRIGMEYRLEDREAESLFLLFRSDDIRDDRNAGTRFYTLISEGIEINE